MEKEEKEGRIAIHVIRGCNSGCCRGALFLPMPSFDGVIIKTSDVGYPRKVFRNNERWRGQTRWHGSDGGLSRGRVSFARYAAFSVAPWGEERGVNVWRSVDADSVEMTVGKGEGRREKLGVSRNKRRGYPFRPSTLAKSRTEERRDSATTESSRIRATRAARSSGTARLIPAALSVLAVTRFRGFSSSRLSAN